MVRVVIAKVARVVISNVARVVISNAARVVMLFPRFILIRVRQFGCVLLMRITELCIASRQHAVG